MSIMCIALQKILPGALAVTLIPYQAAFGNTLLHKLHCCLMFSRYQFNTGRRPSILRELFLFLWVPPGKRWA